MHMNILIWFYRVEATFLAMPTDLAGRFKLYLPNRFSYQSNDYLNYKSPSLTFSL